MADDVTQPYDGRETFWSSFSLLTSLGTLVCCALPALLVTIGAGAALAGLVSTMPWLVALSKYKVWTFSIAGAMLMIAGYFRWQSRNAPCPIDPDQARACIRLRKISFWIYACAVGIYLIGFFFAFIAVYVFY